MKRSQLTRAQSWSILGGAAVMLSLAMGMRQSWGLFQPHMIRDLGITAADFSLAIAIQNIVWGATQPFVGALADRHGARRVMLGGALIYALGTVVSLLAPSALVLTLGAGICIGIALSCTAATVAMNVTSRTVSPLKQSVAMGSVSAIGSLGLTLISPLAQSLITNSGWQVAMVAFVGLAVVMLPVAYLAGGVDKLEIESAAGLAQSIAQAACPRWRRSSVTDTRGGRVSCQAASTSSLRAWLLPDLVMAPRRRVWPELCSLGTSPR